MRLYFGDAGEEAFGVGVLGGFIYCVFWADFNDLAVLHNGDFVRHDAYDPKVMRYKEVGEFQFLLKPL